MLEQSDFAIHTGRRIGLIGPNGCGKSSLFQMLLGNLAIDAGELRVPGSWRIAHMAQEVAASDHSAVQYVMDGDVRLRAVLAEIEDTDDHDDEHEDADKNTDQEANAYTDGHANPYADGDEHAD